MTIEAKTGEARGMDNAAMLDTAFLYGANAVYIEQLYAQYAEDPNSVPESWQRFFRGVADTAQDATKAAKGPEWKEPLRHQNGELVSALDGNWATDAKPAAKKAPQVGPTIAPQDLHQQVQDSIRAIMMIRAYRMRGHLAAHLDPLAIAKQEDQPELDPKTYGFGPKDMDRRIYIDNVLGLEYATPRQMIDILRRTYCGTFAVEFMHISDPDEKSWLQQRIEGKDKEISFTPQGKRAILKKLVEAEAFERFLHKRYPGTKRFGLDGGEAAVPALEQIIKRGGALGVDEIIVGMPHRGRLNVLAAVMGKPYHKIFFEFQGGNTQGGDDYGSGDVKYHLGASSDREFDGHSVHLSLTANPSHLEIVNPVVLGKARAKQFFDEVEAGGVRAIDPAERNKRRTKVMPLLLHGDAAFAGQGVVAECFALSGLAGYRTGGAMHFIVNNQIGFTTAPSFSRSSPYPSDMAKMVDAPVFHVNGDDPEAVVYAAKGRHGIPPAIRQGRGHRHVLLSPLRSQRGRRPDDDPAADVREDPRPVLDARTLFAPPCRRRRHHRRRRRQHGRRDGCASRLGVREGQDVQARRRRLARR